MLVFDANWNSVEDLYLGMGSFPSRILFQLAEYRTAGKLGWKNGVEEVAAAGNEIVHRARRRMPPGWFISGGFITMPLLARQARGLAAEYLGDKGYRIAVFTSPHYLPLRRSLKPEFSVYHAVDDYTHYWPKRAATTRRRETALIAEADMVICAGAFLATHLAGLNPDRARDIHHIPNPVPIEFLSEEPTTAPYFAGTRPKPVLGYVGAIQGRLELEAMLRLARALPQADIRVHSAEAAIGSPFSNQANIKLYPPVPRRQVPALIREFDVCLLPQPRSHFISCGSPRKLYEYLGSSRPVVALNTPEAESLGPEIVSTSTTEEFVQAVAALLKYGEKSGSPQVRLNRARELTPSNLAKRYASLLALRWEGRHSFRQ